jgi:protein O-GlcNAc transferase
MTTIEETLAQGVAHLNAGRLAEAEAALAAAAAIEPARRGVNFLRGRCRLLARDFAAAAEFLDAELALDPAHVQALIHRGVACYELERLDDAEASFRRAIALKPDEATAWNNLAAILLERGDPDAAAAHYDEAAARDPAYAEASSNRLMCEQFRADVTPERLLALSTAWDARHAPATPVPLPPRPRGEKIRVGFVSPDFCRAPVGYFLIGLLEHLPRDIATVLYSDTILGDDLTQRLMRAAGAWRDVRGVAHAAFAQRVRADAVDVLIDLAGHTKGNRLPAFALRAAPVQASWAGYAGTTGLARMDYLVADRFEVPDGAQSLYCERVLRLPDGYVCYTPPDYAPSVGPLPAARNGFVTFAAFHNAGKIGALSLALWSKVLAAVPGSRLVLKYRKLDDPRVAARIAAAVAAAGVAPERVAIEGTSPHIAMLARYNDVDIALDAAPYSGGLTSCEALWMGVPVVTLPGRTFAGRHTLTHLMNVGLPRLVAADAADYVRIAAGLAGDLAALAGLRATLRPLMASSPLCDGARFAQDFAMLLRQIAP